MPLSVPCCEGDRCNGSRTTAWTLAETFSATSAHTAMVLQPIISDVG